MLVSALDAEVGAYVERHRRDRDEEGRALVVRNGKARPRPVGVARDDVCGVPCGGRGAGRAFRLRDAAKYPKAVASLTRDQEQLYSHFDFPAEHWKHIRSTNVIESAFATVRLRQRVTKGAGSRSKGLTMAFKLLEMAQQRWRKLNAPELLPLVLAGERFKNGMQETDKENTDRKVAA